MCEPRSSKQAHWTCDCTQVSINKNGETVNYCQRSDSVWRFKPSYDLIIRLLGQAGPAIRLNSRLVEVQLMTVHRNTTKVVTAYGPKTVWTQCPKMMIVRTLQHQDILLREISVLMPKQFVRGSRHFSPWV